MNWFARMIYPYEKGASSNGHYDLQIVGDITFDGIAYTNPIFSYGSDNGVGIVQVFNRSITNAVYKVNLPFKGYHYNRKTSSTTAQYNAFLSLMRSCIDLSSKTKVTFKKKNGKVAGYGYRYKVTTAYKDYKEDSRNCFTALGLWLSELGEDRFKNFAAAADDFTEYTAYAMVRDYPEFWDLQGTYTSY